MTSYQIAPYIFQVKTRGSNPAVIKTLANIDGKGTSLEEAVGNILAAMLQRKKDYQDKADPNKQYMLSSVRAKAGIGYFLTVEPGRKGLQSTLRQSSGSAVSRTVGDVEYVPLRHLIYFPPNGHTAIVFAERHGRFGSMSFLKACMHQVLTEKFPALTVAIPPLTTLEALEAATFNKVIFRAPRRRDASGRLLDYGARVAIDIGFKGKRKVKDLLSGGKKIDSKKVFGILTVEGGDAGVSAPLDTKGWDATLSVTMENGRPRKFKVGDAGPSLLYPISGATLNGNVVSPTSYPTDDEFLGVCELILEDISGQYDVVAGQKLPKYSQLQLWNGSQSTPWEVTYYDGP